MGYACSPGAGFRRFDAFAAEAETLATSFAGLPGNAGPSQALAAFKRAAPYMQIPASVVQLIDTMFAWTRPQDWAGGSTPVVWPRNDMLARKLGLGVRQLQNLLDRAIRLRLISHKDSPNGHRGGKRDEAGAIIWAYGVVLAPIGTRMEEFTAVAKRGAEEDALITGLKKRLGATRRRISALAQTAIDEMLDGTNADDELALVLSATRQMRSIRDIDLLTGCVEQMEERARRLEAEIGRALKALASGQKPNETADNACSDAARFTHSTTTTELQSAKADTRSGLADEGSGMGRGSSQAVATAVEDDLEKHGVDPDFIESVAPEICFMLASGRGGWGDVVHLAERLAQQTGINRHAWNEACRLMGDRGAAASVIATVHKYHAGEVRQPGAYLRGMSRKVSSGELNLGKTFHGLKDNRKTESMQALRSGTDPSSVGQLARRALSGLVLSGRPS